MQRLRSVVPSVSIMLAVLGCRGSASSEGDARDRRATIVESAAGSDAGAPAVPPEVRRVPGQVLVRFRTSASPGIRATAAARLGARTVREFRSPRGLSLLEVQESLADRTIAALRASPDVLYAEPNYAVHASAVPDDPLFPQLWGLRNTGQSGGRAGVDVDAPAAWDVTTGSRAPVVVVIDSGVDYAHPDLAANMYRNAGECDGDGADDDGNGYADDCHGIDVIAHDADPMDEEGHGTHVAGIIGAVGNNGVGVTGVAWTASMLACRSLDANGDGTVADAIACLDYVAALKDRGVNIVATNDSWGGAPYSAALADAIAGQRQRGILFVAAAGNDSVNLDLLPDYPCAYDAPNLICVAASDAGGTEFTEPDAASVASFSNAGKTTVHVAAPGIGILSTVPIAQGSYAALDGTSMASPHVTGALALLYAHDPGLDWRAARNLILSTGDRLSGTTRDRTVTRRQLNLARALTCRDSVVTRRLSPRVGQFTTPGHQPLLLSALSIRCAQPAGDVTVTLDPGGPVTLHDDGVGGDTVAGDGVYSALWQPPPGSAGSVLAFPTEDPGAPPDWVYVHVDQDLEDGFPARTYQLPGLYAGGPVLNTLVGDIDGDPEQEIVMTGLAGGPLYAFDPDGRPVPGWPVFDAGTGVGYPTLGKVVAGRPGLQVVAGYYSGNLAAYDGAGALLPGWPPRSTTSANFDATPVAVDVDGDGLDEVIALGEFRGDGTDLFPALPLAPATAENSAAVSDLLGDGSLEIVSVSTVEYDIDGAYAWLDARRVFGPSLPGFPVRFGPHPRSYPVVGDVDGDGVPEIVVVALEGILVYDPAGRRERTIPLPFVAYGAAPALGDLDGDGTIDIVVQCDGMVVAVRGDGTALPGWPVHNATYWYAGNGPVIGDVDGDGVPDVVFTTTSAEMGCIHVLRADGTPHPRFPKKYSMGSGLTPAIADIDGDGRNELAVGGTTWHGTVTYAENLWVYDLGGAGHGPVPWGQFNGNARHTGTAVAPVGAPFTVRLLTVSPPVNGTIVTSRQPEIQCGSRCLSYYEAGTTLELVAQPTGDYHFVAWTGACAGQPATCTLTLNADRAVGAEFARNLHRLTVTRIGTGDGTVTSTPAGVSCGTSCAADFVGGTRVDLYANAASGSYANVTWGGACAGRTFSPCYLTIDEDTTVTAEFTRARFSVHVSRAGAGSGTVTSVPAGIDCGATCSAAYDGGTEVTLTATPALGSRFVGWSGACTASGATCQVTDGDMSRSVSARFEPAPPPQAIAVTLIGTGSGTVTSTPAGISCGAVCTAMFDGAAVVTLTASAASGSRFGGWSGDCAGVAATCQVAASAARAVTARFELSTPQQYAVTVARAGTGSGMVTSSPSGISCGASCTAAFGAGTMVTLTATAASNSTFVGWAGDCAGASATCQVTANAERSVTARFDAAAPQQFALTIARTGTGSGTVTSNPAGVSCGAICAASFDAGSAVTLTATAVSGSSFSGWGSPCSGTDACRVTVNADTEITAVFTASGGGGGGGGGGCGTGAGSSLVGALAIIALRRRRTRTR